MNFLCVDFVIRLLLPYMVSLLLLQLQKSQPSGRVKGETIVKMSEISVYRN